MIKNNVLKILMVPICGKKNARGQASNMLTRDFQGNGKLYQKNYFSQKL